MNERFLEDSDVKLMLRVRDGDTAAFDELAQRHASCVVNFCHRIVGSPQVAEDLAQDVFLKALKAASSYAPTAKFRTWLLTIATNVCFNRRRWQKRHQHHSLDATLGSASESTFAENLAGDTPMPDDRMDRQELSQRVRTAILELPDTQRAAVVMARYHEMSYAEIAEAMRLSVMAVKSLLNRAKENLREKLSRELRDHVVLNQDA